MTKVFCLVLICLSGLSGPGKLSVLAQTSANHTMKKSIKKGTFAYDVQFFKEQNVETILLEDQKSGASILVVPGYQGRVMTSTASGPSGKSLGWINYKYIESGEKNNQFNPYGGEERFWLGPEGGPFSIYFDKGKEQSFENWRVPAEIDHLAFKLKKIEDNYCSFQNEFELRNAAGSKMEIGVERSISLLSRKGSEEMLQVPIHDSLHMVAYETENILINRGQQAWTEDNGFLSIWLLCMFNSSEEGVVIMPYEKGPEEKLGKIVEDDYFGKVPSERLKAIDGTVFFKVDGKHRSKIGLSPERAKTVVGSYDPLNSVLTILWYSKPEETRPYVNSKWGEQKNPLKGDAVNAYNDGPLEDGSILGPFYEIESSSPAALLNPGESIVHTQRIFHIKGEERFLNDIMQKVFNISIEEISAVLN